MGKRVGSREAADCRTKVRYRDEKQAKDVRAKCQNRRGEPLRIYECPYCKGFHLTHVNASFRGAA